jgi:hypothetical protein
MPTLSPFYRFTPASLNAGFGPENARIDDILIYINTNVFTIDDLVGLNIQQAINLIKVNFASYNVPLIQAGLELIYPSPWPTITGIQTLNFQLRNLQFAPFIDISITLNAGVVVGNSYTYTASLVSTTVTEPALTNVEADVQSALRVVDYNGAAFFPLEYNYQQSVAYSSIANGRNWILDGDNPVPDPLPVSPYATPRRQTFPALTANQTYMLTLMGKIIEFSRIGTPVDTDIINFLSNSVVPAGYITGIWNNGSFVEFGFFATDHAFRIVGEFVYDWQWQRFYRPTEDTVQSSYILSLYLGDNLPYQPKTTFAGFLYAIWEHEYWDMDFIHFDNCPEPNAQSYLMPIKQGDVYQFNVPVEDGNLVGLTDVLVGIMTEDEVFIQQIGTATTACRSYVWQLDAEYESNPPYYLYITTAGNFSIDDSLFFLETSGGPFATTLEALQAIDAQLTIGNFSYVPNGTGWTVTWNIPPGYPADAIVGSTSYSESGEPFPFVNQIEADLCCGTQFRASVTIPPLADGCYKFCLYNLSEEVNQLYSVSQLLQMKSWDCFSQILEFWGAMQTVTEGFDYYGDWKQRIRVDLQSGGDRVKIEESIYRNSDGTYQRPSNFTDKTVSLHTDYIDLPTQNALLAATRHPAFVLAGQSLFVTGDVEVATTQDNTTETSFSTLAQVKFEAQIQGFQPKNNPCEGC